MIAIDTRDFCIPSDENDYDELVAFADTIAGIQTHEVVSVDVLDKIRDEIEESITDYILDEEDTNTATRMGDVMTKVFQIIDKYRKEQTDAT